MAHQQPRPRRPRSAARGQVPRSPSRTPPGRRAARAPASEPVSARATKSARVAESFDNERKARRRRQILAPRTALRGSPPTWPKRSDTCGRPRTARPSASGILEQLETGDLRPIRPRRSPAATARCSGARRRPRLAPARRRRVATRSTRSASMNSGERSTTDRGDRRADRQPAPESPRAAPSGSTASASASARRTSGDGSSSSMIIAPSAAARSSGVRSEKRYARASALVSPRSPLACGTRYGSNEGTDEQS